ncbi:metalloregulator ArsR/SmtB family transcription factor [Halopseudomonas salina]|uniref:Transcriptional regulator n=1 Tax=Halopseudomonas salina TaxID=1323744 RepID=A0ABQ1P4W5_9GAMM|nr:metalloregulator ArsR/SmtB family transcription factor [Halopseudomonas salina]GGC88968.1 transcriptional regulator [Halopseudomonas salina]
MGNTVATSDAGEELTPTALFKCLADDTRARMTLLIAREGELCVCELTSALNESQPKISRHLAQLRTCGVLEDERRGQWVYYRLHSDLPEWVLAMLTPVMQANQQWLESDSRRLAKMAGRPGRADVCGIRGC